MNTPETQEPSNNHHAPSGEASGAPETAAGDHMSSNLDRVEEFMDDVGKKVGDFTSKIGVHLARLASHVREAAEDCWAEAQSIRRGEPQEEQGPPNPPTTT
jgi:hypothetical protein